MKQVAQNYRSGELTVLDAPEPQAKPGGVLVRSLFSLVSTGTELMKVKEANLSLIGKARARPEQIRKVLDTALQQGPRVAYGKAMNRLDAYTPLGYSLCGVVSEVGRGAERFHVGQVVAAGGNEHALHAEVNWVPTNLCVPVPAGLAPSSAAFGTVGAIALQSVRQAEPQLGDVTCVIGLGLVGQLTVQLLVAAGARVVGIDLVEDRCRLAEKLGAVACDSPSGAGFARIERTVAELSGNLGADQILITAGGEVSTPVRLAAQLARDRGRVVDVGKCRIDLPWNAYYEKELDFRFSRSYGPGRYDDRYELEGFDYPAGYVRWTEGRNIALFLDLLARSKVDVEPLISGVFPVEDAHAVYERLGSGTLPGVGFLFEYPNGGGITVRAPVSKKPARKARTRPSGPGAVKVGFIGAGNYASSMLLPHLADDSSVKLVRVATTRSLPALTALRKFGFEEATTDVGEVLDDEGLDAVFIVTRHDSHAELTCRALARGKTVFVEKPLALTMDEIDRIATVVHETGNDRLMVGFNRRFSPLFAELKERFGRPAGATVARYLVNAGPLEKSSWYLNEKQAGSRFTGEGGHFVDLLGWWIGAEPTQVLGVAGEDPQDLHATLRFGDGSLGSITYLTNGNPRVPKEVFDASCGGSNARLDDFTNAEIWSGRRRIRLRGHHQDKGQAGELKRFVESVRSGGAMPIPIESLIATTRATIAIGQSLASNRSEDV